MRVAGFVALLGLLASACAPLTAERPLFDPLDQVGPAPLREGVWAQAIKGCMPGDTRPADEPCVAIEVARAGDGAWLYTTRSATPGQDVEQLSWRFVIVSALETPRDDAYTPLYVAEYVSLDDPGQPLYAVVAPVGSTPAREVRMVSMIDCDDALREGPIPGVEEIQGEDAFNRVCVASNPAAVREAARRALIENLPLLLAEPHARFVWVSPSPPARGPEHVASLR